MSDKWQRTRKEDARINQYKNSYDNNSQWGYAILVVAMMVLVCTGCLHDSHQVTYNPNGQTDTYRNCQTPFIR